MLYSSSYREDNVYCRYRDLNLQSCLIAGLGELELIPLWMRENYPDVELDIVEIDTNKKSENFDIIYSDIFTYTPYKCYDLIIMDIWYAGTPGYREEIEVLKSKYFHYLNINGMMSFPMIDMHTTFSYVDLQRKYN